LNPLELIWAADKKWVVVKDVTFRMENVIKLEDETLASISKDDQKLSCNYVIAIQTRYISTETPLDESQGIFLSFFARGECQL
jgi:hypothetical protein